MTAQIKIILAWLPFCVFFIIALFKWYGAFDYMLHMKRLPAKVIDAVIFHSSTSTSSSYTKLYEFILPSGQKVQAVNYIGGAGGPKVGEKTHIFYNTRLTYPGLYIKPKPGEPEPPVVYGSLGGILLVPIFLTAAAIVTALITIVFTRPRPNGV